MTPPWQTTATRMPMDCSMMWSMARKTRVLKASTSSQYWVGGVFAGAGDFAVDVGELFAGVDVEETFVLGCALPEVDFAEVGDDDGLEAVVAGDGAGGVVGSAHVGGVDAAEAGGGEAKADGLGLLLAEFGEGGVVGLAEGDVFEELLFAVADEEDFDHAFEGFDEGVFEVDGADAASGGHVRLTPGMATAARLGSTFWTYSLAAAKARRPRTSASRSWWCISMRMRRVKISLPVSRREQVASPCWVR